MQNEPSEVEPQIIYLTAAKEVYEGGVRVEGRRTGRSGSRKS